MTLMAPKGYEAAIRVEQGIEDAIFAILRTNEDYRAAFRLRRGRHVLNWIYFAAHAYLVHAVHHFAIPVFALHPKEGLCLLDVGNAFLPIEDAGIWGASVHLEFDLDRFGGRFPSLFQDGLWTPLLIERIQSEEAPPKDPGWTGWRYGKTRDEGFVTYLKSADAKRVRTTLGATSRTVAGRPNKKEGAIEKYRLLYPAGHEAAGVPWKTAAAACGVSEKTLRRALKQEIGTK
jgi:hypothetical protein